MTCNAYASYNPAGWICSAADALGKGIAGGLGEGIEGATSKIFTDATDKAEKLFINATDKAEKLFKQALDKVSQTSGQNIGDKVGSNINEFITSSLKGVNLANITKFAGDEFTAAWDQGFQNLNMTARINLLREEITPAIHSFMKGVRENTIEEMDLIRDDIQKMFTNATKDAVLETLPWALLGIALTTAIPLGIVYFYYKMKHNIGKPKLIQESNTVNIIDKIYNGSVDASWALYSSSKSFLKGYVFTAAGLIIGSALTVLASYGKCVYDSGLKNASPCYSYPNAPYQHYYKDGQWEFSQNENYYSSFDGFTPPSFNKKILDDIFSQALGGDSNHSKEPIMEYSPGFYLPLAVGAALATYSIGKSICRGVSAWLKKDEKPIFNATTQEAVNDIISSTKHCKTHGGFFENIILFGPGGTGKTMISKFIAKNSNMNYMLMSGGDLAQHIRRKEHVTELNKLFEKAKSSSGPTIIFIDEAEALCKDRSLFKDDEHIELLDAFLNHTGEPNCAKKIMLVLATNRLSDIDPAVLSRMDHKIAVNPPELEQRVQILELHAKNFFSKNEIQNFFSNEKLLQLAKATDGLTGRDLFKLLNMISNKKAATEKNVLTQDLIEKMIKRFMNQEIEAKNLIEQKIKHLSAASAA